MRIVDVPAQRYAVLRFSGDRSGQRLAGLRFRLLRNSAAFLRFLSLAERAREAASDRHPLAGKNLCRAEEKVPENTPSIG